MPETQLGVQEKRPDLPTPVAPAWDSGLEAIEESPGGSAGKESACNAEDLGLIPGLEDPLEKGMATHSSLLAWRFPWKEEPGGLQSMGS